MLQVEIGASVTLITSYYLYVKIRDARNTCNGCKYPQADLSFVGDDQGGGQRQNCPPGLPLAPALLPSGAHQVDISQSLNINLLSSILAFHHYFMYLDPYETL